MDKKILLALRDITNLLRSGREGRISILLFKLFPLCISIVAISLTFIGIKLSDSSLQLSNASLQLAKNDTIQQAQLNKLIKIVDGQTKEIAALTDLVNSSRISMKRFAEDSVFNFKSDKKSLEFNLTNMFVPLTKFFTSGAPRLSDTSKAEVLNVTNSITSHLNSVVQVLSSQFRNKYLNNNPFLLKLYSLYYFKIMDLSSGFINTPNVNDNNRFYSRFWMCTKIFMQATSFGTKLDYLNASNSDRFIKDLQIVE